jgi:hypothetical protein
MSSSIPEVAPGKIRRVVNAVHRALGIRLRDMELARRNGTGVCECGRTISANKYLCKACAESQKAAA